MKKKSERLLVKENAIHEILNIIGISKPLKHQIIIIDTMLSLINEDQKIEFEISLTSEEQMCLYWAAQGKTSKETAQLLNIEKKRVDRCKESIFNKLDCENIPQAIFKGIRFCYLQTARAIHAKHHVK